MKVICAFLLCFVTTLQAAEKSVVFYPTYGYQTEAHWVIPLRAWVSEPVGLTRQAVMAGARELLEHQADIEELTSAQETLFAERAEDFFRDSESDATLQIVFDDDVSQTAYGLNWPNGDPETDRNGNIQGEIHLEQAKALQLLQAQHSKNGWLRFQVIGEKLSGQGRVRLLAQQGLSVISDIDDTVKVTEILAGKAVVLQHTFFMPFEATDGMVASYRALPPETAFHYVSGGPWQLYRPLSQFLFNDAAFPAGSVHMKNARTNLTEIDSWRDIYRLLKGGATEQQKLKQIGQIFEHFPQRQFILIGDSGEHDPEVFRQLRDQYPTQVKQIRIRDVADDFHHHPSRLAGMVVIVP